MLNTYDFPEFPYVQSDELKSGQTVRHPVVIVGAGRLDRPPRWILPRKGSKLLCWTTKTRFRSVLGLSATPARPGVIS